MNQDTASEIKSCPICRCQNTLELYSPEITSGKDVSFSYTFSPEHSRVFGVNRCLKCTHVFCAPLPANIAVNYKDVVDTEYLKHEVSRKLTAAALIRQIRKLQPRGRLLDIGCATGDFLEVASREGFEAEGLEPSTWSSTIARERGLTVHQALLEEFANEFQGRYDVVTLWGVIEHFQNPKLEVERIRQILRTNGVFAIWTGDVNSFTSRLLGRKWWYWQGQHIQYFTEASMRKLLEDHGFKIELSKYYPFAASYETLNNSLRRYRSHKLLAKLAKLACMLKPIWYLRLPGEMFIVARKVS